MLLKQLLAQLVLVLSLLFLLLLRWRGFSSTATTAGGCWHVGEQGGYEALESGQCLSAKDDQGHLPFIQFNSIKMNAHGRTRRCAPEARPRASKGDGRNA